MKTKRWFEKIKFCLRIQSDGIGHQIIFPLPNITSPPISWHFYSFPYLKRMRNMNQKYIIYFIFCINIKTKQEEWWPEMKIRGHWNKRASSHRHHSLTTLLALFNLSLSLIQSLDLLDLFIRFPTHFFFKSFLSLV